MKPNFALSLSFDGIRLLHRAAGGWRVVGDVALDSPDMAGELAVLRKTASALDPSGVRTKLLLPNEQIKYLSIETPGLSDEDRLAAAKAALDGATPYEVADLAFDICPDGDKTHIAAVAKETLAEAEDFGVEHRFHPVSFAAVPGDHPFLGEPFFGITAGAAALIEPGEAVEPDGIAVVVIGHAVAPEKPAPAEMKASPPEAEQPAPQDASPADAVPQAAEIKEVSAPEVSAPAPQAPVPAPAQDPAPAQAPAVGFASRRSTETSPTPQLGGVNREGLAAASGAQAFPDALPPAASQTGTVTAPNIAIGPDSRSLTADTVEAPVKQGLLSRWGRKKTAQPEPRVIPAAVPAPPTEDPVDAEQQRMTIFGARDTQVRGKPRFLGLILTAALLLFLAGVAAWASVFLDDGIKLSRLFGDRAPVTAEAEAMADQQDLQEVVDQTAPPEPDPEILTAALDPGLTEEDSAVLDALRAPIEPQAPRELTEEELEAAYAVTGIWPRAPQVLADPAGLVDLDDLYLTSIDPVSTSTDAVALPEVGGFGTDISFAALSSPAAAGTKFALDARGMVIPTALGALSPDGFTVFLGTPPLVPPATPTRFTTVPQDTDVRSALAALRPQPRPTDLIENSERAQLDGLTLTELASFRPALRPQSLQEQAQAATAPPPVATDGAVALALAGPSAFENQTKLAVQTSVRPDPRPRNFARIVDRAQKQPQPEARQDEVRVAAAAAVAPRTVQPSIPSKTSVATQATVKNALNLRDLNLIGVYGKPSDRRALVRLGNGRYQKVVVGDRIDGGRVSAIGDNELRYTKRGRDLVLKMPR